MGRGDYFAYGNTACHIYQEFSYDKLDVEKVERVWNSLIKKHDALRTVIYEAGYQGLNVEFERYSLNLAPAKWEKFKDNCSKFNVTPTAGVLTVYSEILKRWSANKERGFYGIQGNRA